MEDTREHILALFRYAQVGQCVNSVSHDLNNLLGVILAYTELISVDSNLSPDSRRMLNEIIKAVQSASMLVNNITDIARKEKPDVRIIDAVQLFERALSLLQYSLRNHRITIEKDFDRTVGTVAVDLPKVVLALTYLITNAMESLASVNSKILRVSVRKNDQFVEFLIWDNAGPIPQGLKEKIFEPFFTTKETPHMGLGLYLARSTAQQHGGELEYYPDRGFVFRIPQRGSVISE